MEEKRKHHIKEKVVVIYEKLFQGQDITQGRAKFWDEFFLLTPNYRAFINLIEKCTDENILVLWLHMNQLFKEAVEIAQNNSLWLRIACATQTIDCILICLASLKKNYPEDENIKHVDDFFASKETFEDLKKVLICNLSESRPVLLRSLALNSLSIWITIFDDIKDNFFICFFMQNQSFMELLLNILTNFKHKVQFGPLVCQSLAILYRFSDIVNGAKTPLFTLASLFSDEVLVNSVSFCISQALNSINNDYRKRVEVPTGIISSISNLFTNKWINDLPAMLHTSNNSALILCLYEIFKRHLDFCSNMLLYSHIVGASDEFNFENFSESNVSTEEPSVEGSPSYSPSKEISPEMNLISNEGLQNSLTTNDTILLSSLGSQPSQESDPTKPIFSFSNILSDLIEYTSIIMLESKVHDMVLASRLCFILLRLIVENKYAAVIIHDTQISFKTIIHKRRNPFKGAGQSNPEARSAPGVVLIFDLVIQFMSSHMIRYFPVEIYINCLQIVHHLLCYQRKWSLRIEYNWRYLWTTLLIVLRYMITLDGGSVSTHDSFRVMEGLLRILDLFLVKADKLLRIPQEYDSLNYELVRSEKAIEDVYEFVLKQATSPVNEDLKKDALRLLRRMTNIRTVAKHFSLKMSQLISGALTEQQVLSVIQENYKSLNFNVLPDLERVEMYNETDHVSFFKEFLKSLMSQLRKHNLDIAVEMQMRFCDLTQI